MDDELQSRTLDFNLIFLDLHFHEVAMNCSYN